MNQNTINQNKSRFGSFGILYLFEKLINESKLIANCIFNDSNFSRNI